jgi:hypothetical protein
MMDQKSQSPEENRAVSSTLVEFFGRGRRVALWGDHLPQTMRSLASRNAQLDVPTSPMFPPCPLQPVQVSTCFRGKRVPSEQCPGAEINNIVKITAGLLFLFSVAWPGRAQTPCPGSDTCPGPEAQMICPTPGTTLPGNDVTFTWCNANADYFLDIESIRGAHNIFLPLSLNRISCISLICPRTA